MASTRARSISTAGARAALLALCVTAVGAAPALGGDVTTPPPVAPATVYLPVNADPASYTGDLVAGHCLQTYRLFLPPPAHLQPPGGWPVLVHVSLSGFATSGDFEEISPQPTESGDPRFEEFLAAVLEGGIAVITATATISLPPDHPSWDAECGAVDPTFPGNGLFHPPGYVPRSLDFAPYSEPDWHMPEKDAVMLIQHVRHNAGRPGHLLEEVNGSRVAVHGSSAAADALMWAAFGPERRGLYLDPPLQWTGQYADRTRPDAAIFRGGHVWWPIFEKTLAFPNSHFGRGGSVGTTAGQLGLADVDELLMASPLYYEDCAANQDLPTYMIYAEDFRCTDITKAQNDCAPADLDSFDCAPGSLETSLHPAWSGFAWEALHPSATRLVLENPALMGMAAAQGIDATLLETEAEQNADIVSWLVREIVLTQPDNDYDDPWLDLGYGVTGATTAVLEGRGSLNPYAIWRLELTDGPPNTEVQFIIGHRPAMEPFQCGTMVPAVETTLTSTTDDTGRVTIVDLWPPDVHDAPLYYQVWFEDPEAPCGWGASNALFSRAP